MVFGVVCYQPVLVSVYFMHLYTLFMPILFKLDCYILSALHGLIDLATELDIATILHLMAIIDNQPIVSAHRRILGMASVVCVLVKICVSSISLYKLDPDKLTTPFESAH